MPSVRIQAAGTREKNSAVRERPVATRSRKTPDSMSAPPAVAPMIAPATAAISVRMPAAVSKSAALVEEQPGAEVGGDGAEDEQGDDAQHAACGGAA